MKLSNQPKNPPPGIPKASQRGLCGDVLMIQPNAFKVVTLFLVLIIALFAYLMAQGSYHRKETVSGYLIPNKGIEKVVTSVVGVIESSQPLEGTYVEKGDVLFEISTQQTTLNAASVNQQIIKKLQSSQADINQRVDDETSVLLTEQQRIKTAVKNSQEQLLQLIEQINIQKNQFQIADQEWNKFVQLSADGYVTDSDLILKKDNLLRIEANLNQTQRTKLTVEAEINNMKNQLMKLPLLHRNKVQDLTERLTVIEERIIQLNGSDFYSIKANLDGIVTSVQAYQGQRVTNGTYLLSIVPAETKFYAELFLPSRAIGFIETGQNVRIRYDAFPYQQFGQYAGVVKEVAKAPINPNDLDRLLPTQDPVYRVKVELDTQEVSAFGKQMNLQAGMSISADIMLEKRTLLDWLLAPYYAIKGRI